MRALVLSDLRLALADMLGERDTTLKQTAAGRLYRPRLAQVFEAIKALPEVAAGGLPLAEALAETDSLHDGYGAAIWHYTEAMLRAPDVDEETRRAAERIRASFIPELAQLRASYASEAAAAVERRATLQVRKEDLRRFPIPNRRTLASWAEGFVQQGEQLLALLTERANTIAKADGGGRSAAGMLRGQAISLLQRLRTTLADEFTDDPAKLREYDKSLFSFVDQLASDREAALRRQTGALEAKPTTEGTPAPATDTTSTPE